MLTTVRYVLLTALRDRLFVSMLGGIVFASLVAAELGRTAFLEEHAMTLSLASASARMILVVGVIVFVCFHIKSLIETRELDVMLSRPISRTQLVMAFALGFALVAVLLVVPIVGIIGFIRPEHWIGFAAWSLSLLLEAWLVITLALFCAFTMRSAVMAVMAGLGMYVLMRMMAYFVMTAQSGFQGGDISTALRWVLQVISVAIPRMDLFAKSEWLVYGLKTSLEWNFFLTQALIFVPLLLGASILDVRKKEF